MYIKTSEIQGNFCRYGTVESFYWSLAFIVLSLENYFKKPQMIIVLMKQMWKTTFLWVFCFVFKSSRDLLTEVEMFAFQCAACLCFWRCRLHVGCPQSLGISPKFLCTVWQFTSHSCFDELTVVWLGGGLELCFPS